MKMSHHLHSKPKPSSRRRSNLDKSSSSREREIPMMQLPPPNVIARLMGIDAIQTSSSLPKPPAAAEAPLSQEAKCSSRDLNGDSRHYYCLMNKMRVPRRSRSRQRRRHPQEDLLQKIKHDFQAAWHQAAASNHSSSAARQWSTSTSSSAQLSLIQMVAQENLRKQKMARYGLATTTAAMEDGNPLNNNDTSRSMQQADDEPTKLRFRDDVDEDLLQPTPIVLLKPGTSSSDALLLLSDGQRRPLLFGLPKVTRDANMSRFLQEVKGMLQQQLKANATASDPKPKPEQTVANQTRQSVGKDKRFFRSKSFRGFRSDRKRKQEQQASSPDRIVTRNQHHLLAHTTTSRRATPTVASPNKDDEESVSSITGAERVADVSPPSGVSFGEQSFRSECHKDDSPASSARALFRSFSAPELGFSFSLARLLGHGGVPSQGAAAMTSCNNTSSAFGFIRGLKRHSFSLRRNLLRRTTQKTSPVELHPQMASPETFNLFKVAQANLTELPPSPVSPLEVAGHSCRHLLSDFNCTLPAQLSPKCLSEFEAPASELSYRTDVETACDQDKAYIREVLVAAGLLYDDGSLQNKANARVDDYIFEEVEDMYYYRGKYCDDAIAMCSSDATDHRMLFDLANEALQSLVQQQGSSSLRQWILDSSSTGVSSRGRTLVDHVWQQVQTLRNPQMQEMQTIDSMVAYEIRKSAWAEALYEDVYVVGRKIERAIFDELIQDLII